MPERLQGIARQLRGASTSAEQVLWRELRKKQIGGFRFRRQVVLCGFIVDFACYESRLVVEVDGATHSSAREIERDSARDAKLSLNGNAVLRFTNDEIFHNIEGALETIRLKLNELRPRMDVRNVHELRDPPP